MPTAFRPTGTSLPSGEACLGVKLPQQLYLAKN